MLKAKVGEISKYIGMAYAKKKTIFLHGAPGIGKSTAIHDAAKQLSKKYGEEFGVIDIRLSQLDPTDLGGIPVPKDNKMHRYYPAWWPTEGKGILLFDEMNKGTPSTQAAAYQMVLDRRMGDIPLGDGWIIVAAGNRSTDRVTVFEMDSALRNRFAMHLEVEKPTNDELAEYFNSIDKADMQVEGFLRFKPSRVFYRDDEGEDAAWASPRSWEQFIDLKTGLKDFTMLKNIACGSVGDVVGREFAAFVRLSDKVDINQVLSNPSTFASVTDPDVKYSVITEIADRYKQESKLGSKCIDFAFAVQDAEYVMLALTMFSKANRTFIQKLMEDDRAENLAEYMQKFL